MSFKDLHASPSQKHNHWSPNSRGVHIASVHEKICFEWSRTHEYPLLSSVLILSPEEWSRLIYLISRVRQQTVLLIIQHLTFKPIRTPALFVTPFVGLADLQSSLALIPHSPLASKVEDNILRVFSTENSSAYGAISSEKENAMARDLVAALPRGSKPTRSVQLPNSLPDIDLLVESETESCVLEPVSKRGADFSLDR